MSDEVIRTKVNSTVTQDKRGQAVSLEAAVMDLADDIAYSLHDFEDFFAESLIDIARLRRDIESTTAGFGRAATRLSLRTSEGVWAADDDSRAEWSGFGPSAARELRESEPSDANLLVVALGEILGDSPGRDDVVKAVEGLENLAATLADLGWSHSRSVGDTEVLRDALSDFVGAFFADIRIRPSTEAGDHVYLLPRSEKLMRWLKVFARLYVVDTPRVALSSRAQERCIQNVFRGLEHWIVDDYVGRRDGPKKDSSVWGPLPQPLPGYLPAPSDAIDEGTEDARVSLTVAARRAIADYICTLSDVQCLALSKQLQGVGPMGGEAEI